MFLQDLKTKIFLSGVFHSGICDWTGHEIYNIWIFSYQTNPIKPPLKP